MYVESNGQDQETDVIVVGTGPAGLTAVASAVARGAKTVAIEAYKHIGGNGLYSTGWVAFVDSKLQKELGVQDSVELFMKDCSKLLDVTSGLYGLYWDQELSKLYAEESSKMYDIMTDRGVRFTRLIRRPLQTSVDRLAAVEDTSMFPKAFAAEFDGPDVRTYLKSIATRLIVENGSVRGVYVDSANGQAPAFKVRARKAVILASGGYGANPRLRRHFQRDPANLSIYSGLHTCRGDGQLMGQAVGGDLVNMTMIPPIVSVSSQLTEESIAVNLQGNRFHDEAGPYYDRVYALEKQDQKRAFYIFDGSTFDRKSKYVRQMAGDLRKADTVAELACKLAIPAAALERSVQQWNDFMASGSPADSLTGRVQFRPDRPRIAQPPFYSKPMSAGISLTCGGFLVTKSMQVVDVWGHPIPGLFAVGDCAGGFTPTAEMGGTHLGGAFVFGWIAGEAAATGRLAAPHTTATFGQHQPKDKNVDLSMPIISVTGSEGSAAKL